MLRRAVLGRSPGLLSCAMRIRQRTYESLLWALVPFVLLAGILSMHGLTAHDSGMPWMAPAADSHEDQPQSSDRGLMGTVPMATVYRHVPSADHAVAPAGVRTARTSAPAEAGHGVMDLCVAVLSLLLLLVLLGCARADARITSSERLLRSLRPRAGRPPPQYLRPSLTELCIARV